MPSSVILCKIPSGDEFLHSFCTFFPRFFVLFLFSFFLFSKREGEKSGKKQNFRKPKGEREAKKGKG
jgi:hypothetical protein